MIDLTNPIFTDKDAAREHLEAIRWPDGAFCPHCGCQERVYQIKCQSARHGLYKCGECRKQFTVTVGTVFEGSKVPLNKWVAATHMMCSSKKGVSAHQIHRTIGVTYKTAWFMAHRIREAMREPSQDKMGGGGRFVEVDETYIGKTKHRPGKKATIYDKEKVIALVEREGGVRAYHVPTVNSDTVGKIMRQQINGDSAIMTDEHNIYPRATKDFFAGHASVNHSIHEYVRGPIHTNTIEGYFSILKRGINGVYQHCSPKHLKRYLAEYDFRYTFRQKQGYDDAARTNLALKGIQGKRLTYRSPRGKRGLQVSTSL